GSSARRTGRTWETSPSREASSCRSRLEPVVRSAIHRPQAEEGKMEVNAIGPRRTVRRWRSALVLTTAVALLSAASPPPAPAASAGVGTADARGPNEFSLWGGGSVGATTMIGKSTGFDFGLAAVRYGRRLWTNDALSFDWTIDAIPLAFLTLDRSPG